MNLSVTPNAALWFRDEWGFEDGDFVRVFVKYGGSSTVQESFSLGISKQNPQDIALSVSQDGITFFMERDDIWYLDNQDLTIDYQPDEDNIVYHFS